jgi:peptidoglycan L-alanyl-D-glutamate endopeptidase CwlK
MYKLCERSKKNLQGVHPNLVAVLEAAITNSPFEFIITDGIRTVEQQQELYKKGRTEESIKRGEIIVTQLDGIKKKSNHQVKPDGYGYAVDLYTDTNRNGKLDACEITDTTGLKLVATHIKDTAKSLEIQITWGGDFTSFKDYPHFELKI